MWRKLHCNICKLCKDLLDIDGLDTKHEAAYHAIERKMSSLDKKRDAIASKLGIDYD
jgi:hypothetical protein